MAADSVGQIGLDLVVNDKSFKQQMAGIQGLAKKAGAALAGAFAVKKLVDFGKECINLGSDLAEVQNVVDVTFPKMQKRVNEFAQDAAKSFGLSETMAKRYTGTFGAMSKAFGFGEKAAYDMSTTLTGLAGDVASFYNISQDEAYTKLKSVFTGETESLKDLGVVMTQTALDSFALANGFGKTTANMSEMEKVALRYKFVQDQLSTAAGDFSRTSDGWANQVRILQLQFDSLKATIGQGLINALTPVIQVINTIIGKLMSLANAFAAFTNLLTGKKGGGGASVASAAAGMDALAESAANAGKAAGGAGSAAKKAAKDMKGVSTGIDELNIIRAPDESGSGGGSGGAAGGGYDVDDFDMGELETGTDELESRYSKLLDRWNQLKNLFMAGFKVGFGDLSVLDSIQNHLDGIKKSLGEIFNDKEVQQAAKRFQNILARSLGQVVGGFASIGASIVDLLVGSIDKYFRKNQKFIKNKLISLFDISSEISAIVGKFTMAAAEIFAVLRIDEFKEIGAAIVEVFSNTFLTITELLFKIAEDIAIFFAQPFIDNKNKIIETLTGLAVFLSPLAGVIADTITYIGQKISDLYSGVISPIVALITSIVSGLISIFLTAINELLIPAFEKTGEAIQGLREGPLSGLAGAFDGLVNSLGELVRIIVERMLDVWENQLKPFAEWFITILAPYVTTALAAIIDEFTVAAEDVIDFVTRVINILSSIIDYIAHNFDYSWQDAWNDICQFLNQTWESIKEIVDLALNAIKACLIEILNAIKNGWEEKWNGINNFTNATWNNIKISASNNFGAVKNEIAKTWESIKTKTETVWNSVKPWLEVIWKIILQLAIEIFTAIQNRLSEIWNSVQSTIEEKWTAIKSWFAEVWQAIKELFQVEEFVQIGKDILNNLWEGMKSVWSGLKEWVGGLASDLMGFFSDITSSANEAASASRRAKHASEDSDDDDSDWDGGDDDDPYQNGPGYQGHASGGFPKSGDLFVANENGNPEMIGSWGGRAAVANNQQITQGITQAVQGGMRSAIAPLVTSMSQMAYNATPRLAMVGSSGGGSGSQEQMLQDMVNRAVNMSGNNHANEEYILTMIDLLKKIIELIEAMDLTVTIDIREVRKRLIEMEKRTGHLLKTT